MANTLYTKGKEGLLHGTFVLDSDTIKITLLSNSYTPNLSTDEFHSTVSSYVIGTPQTLGGISITNGVFNSSTATWTSVAGGSTVRYFCIYKDDGASATSPLLLLIDTTTGVTLPFATNGGDITFSPDSGANKIFRLS